MVYVCFVRMDLGSTVVTSGSDGGRFIIAFDEVLGSMRDDVESHEKEKDGHSETGEDFCTLKAEERY